MPFKNYGNGIARGLAITLSHVARKPVTTQYPDERLSTSKRIRGTELGWSAQECSACLLCQDSCPHGCIEIKTSGCRNETMPAPCTSKCPANVDAARYISLLARGKPGEAVAVIRERIPFPVVCAYVCAHPCEAACTRGHLDEPIAIRMLKRYAVDNDTGAWKSRAVSASPSGKKVAVIGAGPAGLTAAYYLAVKGGHSVTVFDDLPQPGGMVRVGIPDYRLPKHLLDRDIDEIKALGVVFKMNSSVDSAHELLKQGFDAVFVSIGAHQSSRMKVPGDDDPRVLGGVEFLRPVNLGRKVEIGKRVVVVGGGNTAMDAARTAVRLGAKEVSIVYRRSRTEMPAAHEEIEDAEAEGVKMMLLANPSRIFDDNGQLKVECLKMRLGVPDESGRRKPEPVEGSEFIIEVDNVIAAIGQKPVIPEAYNFELEWGNIKVGPDMATSVPGIFSAGDCATGPATIIEGIAGARTAAESIDKFLGGTGDITEKLTEDQSCPAGDDATVTWGTRSAFPMIDITLRRTTFEGAEKSWDKDTAGFEASRCLKCGQFEISRYQLDAGRCIFCGLCVESCNFHALFMGRGYERTGYLLEETILQKEDLAVDRLVTPSAYYHVELEEGLPAQTLLVEGKLKA